MTLKEFQDVYGKDLDKLIGGSPWLSLFQEDIDPNHFSRWWFQKMFVFSRSPWFRIVESGELQIICLKIFGAERGGGWKIWCAIFLGNCDWFSAKVDEINSNFFSREPQNRNRGHGVFVVFTRACFLEKKITDVSWVPIFAPQWILTCESANG